MSIYTDLQSDAVSIDGFANKNALIPTRYGGNKPSYQYLVDGWNSQVNELAKNFNFTDAGFDFATGGKIETYNQLVKDASGNYWQWQGDLPHTVTAGTVPSSPDYEQRTFNEIANISGLRGELDDRTVDLTIAQAQVSDLREGQYVRLIDRVLGLFIVRPAGLVTDEKRVIGLPSGLSLEYVVEGGVVNISHLGAGGNSGDHEAFQIAFDYARNNKLNVVGETGVTYTVNQPINVIKPFTGVLQPPFEFDGRNCEIDIQGGISLFSYTPTSGALLEKSCYNMRFKRALISSSVQDSGAVAFRAAGFIHTSYEEITFKDVNFPFLQVDNDATNNPNYLQGVSIHDCYSSGHEYFLKATQAYDLTINDNPIDAGENGVYIYKDEATISCYNVRIRDNLIQSQSGVGVWLGSSLSRYVVGNYFENNGRDYIEVASNTISDGEIFWEYLTLNTVWSSGEAINTSGTYRLVSTRVYQSVGIGETGATAPTHTTGVVSDGGVKWRYIGTAIQWVSGQEITAVGKLRFNQSRTYRALNAGTTGATAPTHDASGSLVQFSGEISGNSVQPKAVPIEGYRAAFELGQNSNTGTKLGGNVSQDQKLYHFPASGNGMFDCSGDRAPIRIEDIFDPDSRPDNIRAYFTDGSKRFFLHGSDGGVIYDVVTKTTEYTSAQLDYLDTVDNVRVPVVHGLAAIAPIGFGAGLEGKAFPPSVYPQLYAQKAWARGSYLSNPTPEEKGTAGSKYVVAGWRCTTSGRQGTWVESRTLTGN